MTEYRLLADSMMVGEKGHRRRAKRGDVVDLDENDSTRHLDQLLAAGHIVKHGDETDAQKEEFEGHDSAAEQHKADQEEIAKQEEKVASMGGKKSNATEEPKNLQPAGAPKVAEKK